MATTATAEKGPRLHGELRGWLKERREELKARDYKRSEPQSLLVNHATFVDVLLQRLWEEHVDNPDIALVAVGGYGRGKLFPHSDVDVLVLLPDGSEAGSAIEGFIGALWD